MWHIMSQFGATWRGVTQHAATSRGEDLISWSPFSQIAEEGAPLGEPNCDKLG